MWTRLPSCLRYATILFPEPVTNRLIVPSNVFLTRQQPIRTQFQKEKAIRAQSHRQQPIKLQTRKLQSMRTRRQDLQPIRTQTQNLQLMRTRTQGLHPIRTHSITINQSLYMQTHQWSKALNILNYPHTWSEETKNKNGGYSRIRRFLRWWVWWAVVCCGLCLKWILSSVAWLVCVYGCWVQFVRTMRRLDTAGGTGTDGVVGTDGVGFGGVAMCVS